MKYKNHPLSRCRVVYAGALCTHRPRRYVGTVVMYRRRRDNLWYCNETFAPLTATIKASLVILRMKR